MILELIQQVGQHPQRCEELFGLALALFKRLAESSIELVNLDDVVRQWTSLLLYGRGSRDVRISTFTFTCGLCSYFYRLPLTLKTLIQ
jgi:hypothetical protein